MVQLIKADTDNIIFKIVKLIYSLIIKPKLYIVIDNVAIGEFHLL